MLLSCCCFALLLATASARSHRLSSSSSSNAIDDSTDLMSRVPKSIGDMIGCKAVPSMKMFKFLNRICEDCFQLYRDPELYQMCRCETREKVADSNPTCVGGLARVVFFY